jgi:hypothetical protein
MSSRGLNLRGCISGAMSGAISGGAHDKNVGSHTTKVSCASERISLSIIFFHESKEAEKNAVAIC